MARNAISGTLGALLFGAIFAVVGFVVAFFVGKPILDKAQASEQWPSVNGVVVNSEVVTKQDDDGTMYSADVVYRYAVEGREYKCSTVSFGGDFSSSSSSHAYAVTNEYPAGSEVQVFYNPHEPSTATLETGTTWMSYLAFGIGLIFLAVGLLVCVIPLIRVSVAAIALGGAAAGSRGRAGSRTAGQAPNSLAGGASSAMSGAAAATVHEGIDIR